MEAIITFEKTKVIPEEKKTYHVVNAAGALILKKPEVVPSGTLVVSVEDWEKCRPPFFFVDGDKGIFFFSVGKTVLQKDAFQALYEAHPKLPPKWWKIYGIRRMVWNFFENRYCGYWDGSNFILPWKNFWEDKKSYLSTTKELKDKDWCTECQKMSFGVTFRWVEKYGKNRNICWDCYQKCLKEKAS